MQAVAATIHRRRELHGSRAHTARPRAMTLVEVLLVLVLLVIVGSLAAPLFEGSFSSVRLRRGADQVLAAWSDARTHAIEAGYIYQFRFKPDGNSYRIDRWTGGVESDPALATAPGNSLSTASPEQSASLATTTMAGSSDLETELLNWSLEETLPEQVTFSTAQSISTDEAGQRRVDSLDQGTTSEWSSPILFYPDGRTTSASLLLKNNNDAYCRATLRALTGVGRASGLLSRDSANLNPTR